ncbi:putative oxidoreductase [Burkholderiales bacterium 8X]|nr:putative oxidoreductase [Burkholderiales bacterium 8X]
MTGSIPIRVVDEEDPSSSDSSAGAASANDLARMMRPGPLQLSALPPLSLYIHVPWCLKKCPYCDFNSHARAEGGELPERRYVDALLSDLDAALPLIWGRTIQTIFIGGGTPSLFSPAAIDRLLSEVRARVRLVPDCEITLEANPGTFERDRFRGFRAAGVTRLSIGVQSFDDRHLEALGRVHDGRQARAAIEEASSSFDTFNIDLMYALPGQDLADLEQDLAQALATPPPHLSIYHLTIEPNTFFAKYPPALPEDDLAYQMLDRIAEATGAAGMARYEVSAFARAGHRCVHNLNYWQFGDYLGIGAGAHSKISFAHRVVRQVRYKEPNRYMEKAELSAAVAQSTEVRRSELAFEFMLNALRLKEGFRFTDFVERTGLSINAIASPLSEAEAKGLLARDLSGAWPTDKGFDFLSDLQELFLGD